MEEKQAQQFIDHTGRKWPTRLTLGDAMRLRTAGNDIMEPKFLESMLGDPLRFIELFSEAMRPHWEPEMNYNEFANIVTFGDESFTDAKKAFEAGIVDFFRRIDQPAMAALVERAFRAAECLRDNALKKANGSKVTELLSVLAAKADANIDAEIERETEKLRRTGISSTNTSA